MRFNPLVKKIFSDDLIDIEIVTKREIEKSIKTKKVLLNVDAFMKMFKFFVSKGNDERVCLLLGKISGSYLVVENVYCCHNAEATPTHVKIPSESYNKALENNDGNYIIGHAHSHPSMKVFASGHDRQVLVDFQALFPDAVSVVMDPFVKNKIEFKFFRYDESGNLTELDYSYMVDEDED